MLRFRLVTIAVFVLPSTVAVRVNAGNTSSVLVAVVIGYYANIRW